MKSSINFDAAAASALSRAESLLMQWLPGGRRSGSEWKCGSLRGDPGDSLGVNINTGRWQDFATGDKGGDLVSLLAAIRGCNQAEAAREIEPASVEATAPKRATDAWTPLPHAPDGAPYPDTRHYKHGEASGVWKYLTAEWKTAGFICRYDTPSGKEFAPLTWCRSDTGEAWRSKAFAEPRPLYGLETVAGHRHVYLAEGEKSADAIRRLLPGECALSWPGGANATAKADWSPLRELAVTIWPDNDGPGLAAALAIQKHLPHAFIARPPVDAPEKWDAADAESDGWQDFNFLARPPPASAPLPPAPPDRIENLPFRLLGVSDGQFFYMPDEGMEIVELSASSHTKLNLMRLAPLHAWQVEFPQKNGADWDFAVNTLIQKSQKLPKFDPRRIRGRGCWIDGPDVVFHAGGHLVVNGIPESITAYRSQSRAIYEGALEIETHTGTPAANTDAVRLIHLCESLTWDRPLYGTLLAGWLALSPICGALGWRPHLWLTGVSGSGKSWVFSNIITPMVGSTALAVQGNTTEAGIRGTLGSDAIPVIFDEAESEDHGGRARLDRVLELARQASSESGAGIIKGTASGGSITYMVRSMFLFASIGVAATKKADTSRITLLHLVKNTTPGRFDEIKALWKAALPHFPAIRARSLANARNIRANAEVFSAAAVDFTGDKRSADQVGALLAGAFSLTSLKAITPEAATAWMARQDWSEYRAEPEDADETQCWSHLMASVVLWERSDRISVGELVTWAQNGTSGASSALERLGMRIAAGRLWVANRHPELERLFGDTPWAGAKWKLQLARMPGAVRESARYFGPSVSQRAVSVPLQT